MEKISDFASERTTVPEKSAGVCGGGGGVGESTGQLHLIFQHFADVSTIGQQPRTAACMNQIQPESSGQVAWASKSRTGKVVPALWNSEDAECIPDA